MGKGDDMESRGNPVNASSSRRRLAIPRRSCDQCRSRKVGCDRGSPCSTCISAKLTCTFGTVASRTVSPKQRILISAQYEQKIDDIAEGLEAIKALLQKSHPPTEPECGDSPAQRKADHGTTAKPLAPKESSVSASTEPVKWDHSAQVTDFVKTVVEDRASREYLGTEESDILASLRRLSRTLNDSNVARDLSFPEIRDLKSHENVSMPPVEAAVLVLRWAKGAISRILPLEKFTELCQRVYFAVDEYSQLDFVLANSYLSYIFSEYIVATGKMNYKQFYTQCRQNAQVALSRLPLLLPTTVETVAALTFGATYAVDSSKATLAWTYISSAANICQTLGLHHFVKSEQDDDSQEAQISLFWLVFLLEKSLSLRLDRSSNFRDAEITTSLPSDANIRRCAQTSRIQGKIYDQLFSPTGLARSDVERGAMAQTLALELREILGETKIVCHNLVIAPGDKMLPVYLKIELVKQLSLLTLILRAVPAVVGSPTTITDECAMAARETLDMHQQAMAAIKDSKEDQFMTHRGILHTPFVPFSVLFTRAVQLSDDTDLHYLDRFSESLRHGEPSSESITHPYRLYSLLCQAARLYIKQNPDTSLHGIDMGTVDPWSVFDFAAFGNGAGHGADGSDLGQPPLHGLSHWFYGNQQLMGLLDDDIMF